MIVCIFDKEWTVLSDFNRFHELDKSEFDNFVSHKLLEDMSHELHISPSASLMSLE